MAERRASERKPAAVRKAAVSARGTRPGPKSLDHPQTLDFRRKNWLLFGGGALSIVMGFLVLSTGEITLAPILILAGYLVLIPWALVARPRDASPSEPKEGGSS